MSRGGGTSAEALLDLRRRLDALSPRDRGRRALVEGTAEPFSVSRATVYRALAGQFRPRGLRRADRGEPRKIPRAELERYCELVAPLKLWTSNLKGRRLSTALWEKDVVVIDANGYRCLNRVHHDRMHEPEQAAPYFGPGARPWLGRFHPFRESKTQLIVLPTEIRLGARGFRCSSGWGGVVLKRGARPERSA